MPRHAATATEKNPQGWPQWELDRRLIEAATRNEPETLLKLLAAGADPLHQPPHGGWTALAHAASAGHRQCVAILAPISDANAKDELGWTPLTLAITSMNVEEARLLAPWTDPSAMSKDGQSLAKIAENFQAVEAYQAVAEIWAQVERSELTSELDRAAGSASRGALAPDSGAKNGERPAPARKPKAL
jgi:hypothetical protein